MPAAAEAIIFSPSYPGVVLGSLMENYGKISKAAHDLRMYGDLGKISLQKVQKQA
jgi:hypothetical protein